MNSDSSKISNIQTNKETSFKTILVTGGAGFIGSHLVDRLMIEGHKVICIDDLQTGDISNTLSHHNSVNYEFIDHDVIDAYDVEVDAIYNLACPASLSFIRADPVHSFKTSILGALNALDLAKRRNIPILQASSSEIYGDPERHPQKENYWGNVNPVGERSCYDEGKRGAETLFADYFSQYGVDTKIVRIFNTYGPRMRILDGRVVTNFIVQALKNEDITIRSDGLQTRSFCYVDDLVDGMIRLMNYSGPHLGPVNLGNTSEYTILELAHLILKLTGSQSHITHIAATSDDPLRRRPDTTLAAQSLGWSTKISLEEGLISTINYIKKALSKEN
jgi:UDP-glucuronate decarboxylase